MGVKKHFAPFGWMKPSKSRWIVTTKQRKMDLVQWGNVAKGSFSVGTSFCTKHTHRWLMFVGVVSLGERETSNMFGGAPF